MGHLIVLFLSVVLLGVMIVGLASLSGRRMRRGTLPSEHPVARDRPAADEPTPAASITASPAQREAARRHTPPA